MTSAGAVKGGEESQVTAFKGEYPWTELGPLLQAPSAIRDEVPLPAIQTAPLRRGFFGHSADTAHPANSRYPRKPSKKLVPKRRFELRTY